MRFDFNQLQGMISERSRVLDLGCGDGALLKLLADSKQVSGYGLEIDPEQIQKCISRGVNVINQNLDRGLGNFEDDSFDTVLMTQALQTMRYPHKVLDEMLRVGKECIITFPNFGHWKARCHLAFKGRMPVSDLLPYEWYDTPNIHFCTFTDFEVLCREKSINVLHRQVVNERSAQLLGNLAPNLFGETAIYRLSK
ncbi:methionine biosynthesis protein MetW [Gilvimarinus sp. SDUM040013]|uniref:Methionine biosynthesis protein MetW n=1 Tax=Gilvimarinus gilvus TaxID=3058038 RepID=A0ABU4S492_9GAMM|nr:methionine biosynthesis protein MetW [Gilvimarinus sp. SDUM040013]MDO3387601.1 methionine biosynthesis protein MetW [Gilvimarinus sp. SDUM040013]MDX6850134.1 methionine biosynthesis protein MetW [Gilvimarinus sp. SDUM040013]